MLIDIDTMCRYRLWSQNIPVVQPIQNPLSVMLQAMVQILDSLCYMDVIAHAFRLMASCQLHGFVGNGKRSVHSHHSCNHAALIGKCMLDKALIFQNGFFCLLFSVAVGDFIAKAGTNVQGFCCIFNRG